MIGAVLEKYGFDPAASQVESLTSGLINHTWKVSNGGRAYIVQRINHHVFRKPPEIAENIRMIADYLKKHAPHYLFVPPVPNVEGHDLWRSPEGDYFRVFPFIPESHTIDVVSDPEQAFEAAFQFGKFTHVLSGFDAQKLNLTIPDFHNLTLRYKQFEAACANGDAERIRQSGHLIRELNRHAGIVSTFARIQNNANVKKRVTHHDTKISNVLFDKNDKGLCVIDLDTVMPGFFFSDVGDMMRTYLSPANEEVKDFDRIEVREEYFRAIVNGYLTAMGDELTEEERGLFLYAGLFMIFMQAIRFLADYFNGDVYYGARYEGHNFVRAGNQVVLLQRLAEKQKLLEEIIAKECRVSRGGGA